jgi:hypothetical protein
MAFVKQGSVSDNIMKATGPRDIESPDIAKANFKPTAYDGIADKADYGGKNSYPNKDMKG